MVNGPRHQRRKQGENSNQRSKHIIFTALGCVLGFAISFGLILNTQVLSQENSRALLASATTTNYGLHKLSDERNGPLRISTINNKDQAEPAGVDPKSTDLLFVASDKEIGVVSALAARGGGGGGGEGGGSLQDVRILVAIAAFDFTQIPHLEEVLDSFHDICIGGAIVNIVIHATVAYPVTFIDMLNSRFTCANFSLAIILKPSTLRLHLVDCHRQLFYDKINDYDLFIYTEEDIQITPRTVSTYLQESRRIQEILERDTSSYSFSDFNVGVVRYEYNFPSNVVIDDKTRHSIQNVTRVYWEHSSVKPPKVPNTINAVSQTKDMGERYVAMANHHQGMFLATRDLLLAWKDRKNCNYNEVKNRPGSSSQPVEGTQRVWMSSHQLFGKRHCNVQQVLPMDKFGALTVLHVPNKNYRRVGKYQKRKFSDGTEEFDTNPDLLTALQLHLEIRKAWPSKPTIPYTGPVKMIDEVTKKRSPLLERRMREYNAYATRGGVLGEDDFNRTLLVEDD